MIGGPEEPPRLIEKILSGRLIGGGRSGTMSKQEGKREKERASDARLINNVGAIFIRQEEGSSLPR